MNFDLTAIFLGIFQGRKSNKLKNWKIKFWLLTEMILQKFKDYEWDWEHFLECRYIFHTFSFICIEISLSDQTPGAETLSKVCV